LIFPFFLLKEERMRAGVRKKRLACYRFFWGKKATRVERFFIGNLLLLIIFSRGGEGEGSSAFDFTRC